MIREFIPVFCLFFQVSVAQNVQIYVYDASYGLAKSITPVFLETGFRIRMLPVDRYNIVARWTTRGVALFKLTHVTSVSSRYYRVLTPTGTALIGTDIASKTGIWLIKVEPFLALFETLGCSCPNGLVGVKIESSPAGAFERLFWIEPSSIYS